MIRNICVFAILMLLIFANPGAAQFGNPVPKQPEQMDGPVNMTNGRKMFFAETDISIPGRGFGLTFTRYYNADGANRSTTGASYMGPKWSHNYQWEVKTSGSRPYTSSVGGIWVNGFYYIDANGVEQWQYGFWLQPPTTVSYPNTLKFHVVTGSGTTHTFNTSGSNLSGSGWQSRIKCTPQTGVRGSFKLVANGAKWAYEYTTRNGIVYRFTEPEGVTTNRRVLTSITDRNGNSLDLHYEAGPEATTSASKYPRLIAVEDELNRFLKFTYPDPTNENDQNYPRAIQHMLFGKGTAQKLTTTYQRFDYIYSVNSGYPLVTAQQWLNAGEARANRIKTGYEYKGNSHYVNAVVTPLGNRHEFELSGAAVNRVKITKPTNLGGAVLFNRSYSGATVYNTTAAGSASSKKHEVAYTASGRQITRIQSFYKQPGATAQSSFEHRWDYNSKNVTKAYGRDITGDKYKWYYKLYYEGADAAHNKRMGNVTKWEQIDPREPDRRDAHGAANLDGRLRNDL